VQVRQVKIRSEIPLKTSFSEKRSLVPYFSPVHVFILTFKLVPTFGETVKKDFIQSYFFPSVLFSPSLLN
jgi:hypothetical protein